MCKRCVLQQRQKYNQQSSVWYKIEVKIKKLDTLWLSCLCRLCEKFLGLCPGTSWGHLLKETRRRRWRVRHPFFLVSWKLDWPLGCEERSQERIRMGSLVLNSLSSFFCTAAVIEHVRDGSTLRAVLVPSYQWLTVAMSGIKVTRVWLLESVW